MRPLHFVSALEKAGGYVLRYNFRSCNLLRDSCAL